MRNLLLACVVAVVSSAANAAVVPVVLDEVLIGSSNGGTFAVLGGGATWTYDTDTMVLTGTGLTTHQSILGPTPLFRREIDDLVINGGVASATSYTCVEGTFGSIVGASLCGNYSFTDFINESTLTYSGTTVTRVIGGNDVALGPPQQLSDYDLPFVSYGGIGGDLIFSTFTCLDADCDLDPTDGASDGQRMTFSVVPVPAAVWLFGSALGLLGWIRRRTAVAS